jgi:ribosomal protein L7Ae-like RNA K-turn-binding protein
LKGNENERLRGMLGFARRAGQMVIGADLVATAMAKRGKCKPRLVLVSVDASEATRKRAFSKSEFYGIEALEIEIGQDELGRLLGKTYAPVVLGITDDRFAEEIKRATESRS